MLCDLHELIIHAAMSSLVFDASFIQGSWRQRPAADGQNMHSMPGSAVEALEIMTRWLNCERGQEVQILLVDRGVLQSSPGRE